MGALVEHCCTTAAGVAAMIEAHPALRLWGAPTLSTVLFRPAGADDELVTRVRRTLLEAGTAVVGRATMPDGVWLKLTLLHPRASAEDYRPVLESVVATAAELAGSVVLR